MREKEKLSSRGGGSLQKKRGPCNEPQHPAPGSLSQVLPAKLCKYRWCRSTAPPRGCVPTQTPPDRPGRREGQEKLDTSSPHPISTLALWGAMAGCVFSPSTHPPSSALPPPKQPILLGARWFPTAVPRVFWATADSDSAARRVEPPQSMCFHFFFSCSLNSVERYFAQPAPVYRHVRARLLKPLPPHLGTLGKKSEILHPQRQLPHSLISAFDSSITTPRIISPPKHY